MPLAAGAHLGPYEIVALIGAGGMGEVYRARDTRLDRTVAVKVLAAHVAEHPEFRKRFEREARAVSSLNHPHICTLHDIGHQDGVDFLVMEYLEGETLAARLSKGSLPLEQALRLVIQMADALAQAHRQGVFHRDLKPGNIMLTKAGAKLLDFGLAKVGVAGRGSGAGETTLDADLTKKGSILGTFQYMAPEQLEGRETDSRTDIFAFGAVLYEMLAGRKAFEGRSQASLIAAILEHDPPPVSSLQPLTPPVLDRVVRKCLAKDPDERWQNAQDLASELQWIAEGAAATVQTQISQICPPGATQPSTPVARQSSRPFAWMAIAVVATLAALAVGVAHFREAPPRGRTVRFLLFPPEKVSLGSYDFPVLSPDGERLAFTGQASDGTTRLWVRPLDSLAAEPLPGTEGAALPFWSPDSRSIAFSSRGLKRVDLRGGPPQPVSNRGSLADAWSPEGVILLRTFEYAGLSRVAASGGEVQPATTLDASRQEISHHAPQFLPDGRHFLYAAYSSTAPNAWTIYAGLLDSQERKLLLSANSNAIHAGSRSGTGHLLFLRGTSLMAQAFDAGGLELRGDPLPVAEQVFLGSPTNIPALAFGAFSASENGALAYRTGSGMGASELVWLDRQGKRLGTVGEPAAYSNPALSPDEKKLVVCRMNPQVGMRDLWLFDLARGTTSRFTFDPADETNPVWSPDGSRIAFNIIHKGVRDIYQKVASGAGETEPLLESSEIKELADWSADGRSVLFMPAGRGAWELPLEGDRKPRGPFHPSASFTNNFRISPNGRWVAFQSNESGRLEVYVRSFPPSGGKWQVSTAGGNEPCWRRDGKELFYREGNKLMAVEVKTDSTLFEAGVPKSLFEARLETVARQRRYQPAANGQRFLVNVPVETSTSSSITVVLNWQPR